MTSYPWHETVKNEAEILQGDFVDSCPIVIPPKGLSTGKFETEVSEYDVIVMSQSCDLLAKKLDLVLVCPVWPLTELGKRNSFLKSEKGKEELRRGNVPGYHLLNKCELSGFETEYLVVDFRSVYSVPFGFLEEHVKKNDKRLRLLPPYREHLSQAFARFIMRVGLPIDIPSFK